MSKLENIELKIIDICDEGNESKDFGYLKQLLDDYMGETGKNETDENLTKEQIFKALLDIRDTHVLPAESDSWKKIKERIIGLTDENFKLISPTHSVQMLTKYYEQHGETFEKTQLQQLDKKKIEGLLFRA